MWEGRGAKGRRTAYSRQKSKKSCNRIWKSNSRLVYEGETVGPLDWVSSLCLVFLIDNVEESFQKPMAANKAGLCFYYMLVLYYSENVLCKSGF